MTTITIERSLLERLYLYWLEDADPYWLEDADPHELDEFTAQVRAALSAPATAPAWHDAPTVPGVWICDEGDICYTWTAHNIEILDQFDPGDGLRWYGPIPEDRQ